MGATVQTWLQFKVGLKGETGRLVPSFEGVGPFVSLGSI